jgi:hypothetical protein
VLRQLTAWLAARVIEGVLGTALLVVLFGDFENAPDLAELYDVMFLVYWFQIFSGYLLIATVAQAVSKSIRISLTAHLLVSLCIYFLAWLVFSVVMFDFAFEIIRRPYAYLGFAVVAIASYASWRIGRFGESRPRQASHHSRSRP